MTKDEFDSLKPGDTIYWTPTGEPETVLHRTPHDVVTLLHSPSGVSVMGITAGGADMDIIEEYSLTGQGSVDLPAAMAALRKQSEELVAKRTFHITCLEKLINANA